MLQTCRTFLVLKVDSLYATIIAFIVGEIKVLSGDMEPDGHGKQGQTKYMNASSLNYYYESE